MRKTNTITEALEKLNTLNEDSRIRVLDEELKGYFKNQYLPKFVRVNRIEGPEKEVNKKAFDMALKIAKIDPTFKGRDVTNVEQALNLNPGSYFDWLIRLVNKGIVPYEHLIDDAQEITDRLGMFDDLKKHNKIPADKKDIMHIKDPGELQDLILSLGGDIQVDADTGTSFKSAIKNIRGALISICGFKDDQIPAEIKNTEDALTLLCENDKWEVYKINSVWGNMLTDTFGIDWGAGATWCTGGQYGFRGSPRKGMELLSSAQNFYSNYTRDSYLVDFIQKDTSVKRPYNAAQLQVDNDNYGVSNFFHSNDSSISLGTDGKISYSSGYGYGRNTSEVLAAFLVQEGLLEPMKKTIMGKCEAIADAENKERLERGEPYEYGGGKIKDMFKSSIDKIIFEYDGKKYEVSAKEEPKFLDAETVSTMFNIKELSEGKPYVYDGSKIPEILRPLIKELSFTESYAITPQDIQYRGANPIKEGELAIPNNAFRGCKELKKINLPASITTFGFGCFKGVNEGCVVLTPRMPNRSLHAYAPDIEQLKKLVRYTDEDVQAFNSEEPKAEEKPAEEQPKEEK